MLYSIFFFFTFGLGLLPQICEIFDGRGSSARHLYNERTPGGQQDFTMQVVQLLACSSSGALYQFVHQASPYRHNRRLSPPPPRRSSFKFKSRPFPSFSPSYILLYFPPHPSITEQLKALFSVFGNIEECRVMMDKKTGRSRQIGFVRFTNQQDATNALKQRNGYRMTPDSPSLIGTSLSQHQTRLSSVG